MTLAWNRYLLACNQSYKRGGKLHSKLFNILSKSFHSNVEEKLGELRNKDVNVSMDFFGFRRCDLIDTVPITLTVFIATVKLL